NPDRRAVPVAGHRHDLGARAPILAPGDHPHVLDRAALQDPPEVDFALALMADAVGGVRGDVCVPVADELAVQVERFGTVDSRTVRMQHRESRGEDSRGVRNGHLPDLRPQRLGDVKSSRGAGGGEWLYFSASARRSSVVTRVPSARMNAISLLVVMKRAPFRMYSI